MCFSGHVASISGCGPNQINKVALENGPYLGAAFLSDFYFYCSYDTSGIYKWGKIDNPYINNGTFTTNYSSDRIYFSGLVGNNNVINGDTIITCLGATSAFVGTLNQANGNITSCGTLCASDMAWIDHIDVDAYNKVYVIGRTKCDAISAVNNSCYPVQNSNNWFYASMDSFMVVPTGITQELIGNEITIYPNPSFGNVYIRLPEVLKNTEVIVVDMFGKEWLKKDLSLEPSYPLQPINLRLLPGVYVVKIKNGTSNSTRKLIIN